MGRIMELKGTSPIKNVTFGCLGHICVAMQVS